jgi:very-short-patch-repair endonuclease
MNELSLKILENLKDRPNQFDIEISRKLDIPRAVGTHYLNVVLKDRVIQCDLGLWQVIDTDHEVSDKNNNGEQQNMDISANTQLNENFAFDSLQSIRNRLLDLTGRNRLLNFKHGRTGFIRIIDEMPDQLAQSILDDGQFTFIPVDEPLREELIEQGYIVVNDEEQDVKVKANPSAKEWAKIKGFNTSYELPASIKSEDSKHNDTNIQSLLYPRELEAQLRNIRTKANTAIEETGANILYLAFGFLEWFEDENSSVVRQAPLYLIPVKIDRAALNKDLGTYTYTIEFTGEDIIPNLSLREKLKHDFHLELPELTEDILPEEYLKRVERQLLRHKPQWRVKRFSTLSMFDFGKLLMYLDLDPSRWPEGSGNIQNHAILQKFFAKEGVDDGGGMSANFCEEYLIDKLDDVHNQYPLIDDADSSQHSALVDAIQGKNLVIEGPPGSGKSQTITNLIAAAISQGKKVLFVAEKMAALQVVKSRLARAGLGDFCLELHSHKTQKKQVYENIAKRINNQGEYRYPSSIEIDIQMYEDKKEALSKYANLINSTWKNTGKTIHQIFATATRYREEFTEITIEDIKPSHINGQSFDEISSRKTTDELKRYADVFEEVKRQLGAEAELSDHPWFGVYNKAIQLFDCDDICKALSGWNESFDSLEQSTISLNKQLNGSIAIDITSLKLLLEDRKHLPKLKGTECFPALNLLSIENEKALNEYIKQYQSVNDLLKTLEELFEPSALSGDESLKLLIDSNNNIQQGCKNAELKLTDTFQQLQLLKSLRDVSLSITEDLHTLIEQDHSLSNLLSPSFDGFTEFKQYFEHINSLDVTLVSRRHELFDNELLDQQLANLEELLPKIQPLHKKLEQHFNLEILPSVNELKEIDDIIKNTGFFCWFSGDWRAAKTKLLSYAKGLKPKVKNLAPLMSSLIDYRELSNQLNKDTSNQAFLQHEFKGIDTPIVELISIRNWYKAIRLSYGVGFGQRVAFANSLFSIDGELFKGLKHLATSKTLAEFEQFFQLFPQLENVFDHPLFENKKLDLSTDIGISAFTDQFENDIKTLQSLCKKDFTLNQISMGIKEISSFISKDNLLIQNTISIGIFGEDIKLLARSHSTEQLSIIQSTLDLSRAINSLESEPLKEYLLNNVSSETVLLLQSNLSCITAPFHNYQHKLKEFSSRVNLDESAWFKGTEGKFTQLNERNNKAISNPRWLSTWVDFIRVRASLSDKGLENLLRYTETGSLDLENIEKIYTYSVFDVLAREIISENQALAYFSGADQNAIRKQFGEYDNKLKKLQQEKIAYQVAQSGIGQTISGVSNGKVASYTEMGLINNEVNKKTRHAPIRQLVRRANKSLIALKPCFMMGPHSVAQYLAPGQIEFDLVVMDEASQIKPQDALGTIARGKQLVVVGDPKQLPPTSFFDKAVENDEEDATAIEQSESILDVSFPMFNARRLRWHYRSRHESLIAFSNQEFYDSNLVVFPSPSSKSDEFGIKFIHVKTGRFVNQHNIEEAKVIAEAVRNHLLHRPHESLGVVAMSAKQREQIERCVEELSKEDSQFRDALAENANQEEALFLKNLENVQGDERDVIYISCTYGPQEAGAAQMPQRFGPINSAAGGRRLNVLFTRSKKRMHVFSSMTEGHIVASDTSSPGVHALKSFLSFAQTGKLQQQKHTGKQPDSDFEISVMDALKLEGFTCVPQVGVAGYFIDLAVQDPGQPGRYLMGVECDGATYHSAKTARDRDRLRQSVLEGLGWNIKRIWSTDWFKNPQAQLKPIIEALHQLKTATPEQSVMDSEVEEIETVIAHENEVLHEIDDFINSDDSLELKLQKFEQQFISNKDNETPLANRILRPAMIAALCEFKPISKSEFLEVIPPYLRSATAKEQGIYLEQVLNIIAEDEVELV